MEKLIAIVGATAVGKTKVSISLAQKLNTEIISGDSMLLYRGLNIGAAKPGYLERQGVYHHLLDVLEPSESFSVADFQQQAKQIITDLNRQNKIPIIAGGTGLYLKALLEDYHFPDIPCDDELRAELARQAQVFGNHYIHDKLREVDPDIAARLHPNDVRRIIRALEVYHLTGQNKMQSNKADNAKLMYHCFAVGLTMERTALYQRINARVEKMIADGLVEEVSNLLAAGVCPDSQAMQGIGYKEIIGYLQNRYDLPEAVRQVQQATRNFAKRQLTWYRRMNYIQWYAVDEIQDNKKLVEIIYKDIARTFAIG